MTIMDKASLSFALGLVRYEVELIANKLIDFLFIVSKIWFMLLDARPPSALQPK